MIRLQLFALSLTTLAYMHCAQGDVDNVADRSVELNAQTEALVVDFQVSDATLLQHLSKTLDVWHVKGSTVTALVSAEQYRVLQTTLGAQNVNINAARTQQLRQTNLFARTAKTYQAGYLTVEEMDQAFAQMAAQAPQLISRVDIGDSWERTQHPAQGRDIVAYRLTRGPAVPKPKAVFVGSIHARELTTSEMLVRLARHLLAQDSPWSQWVLSHREVWLIPFANPDGRKKAEQGLLWRKNTHDQGSACGGPVVALHQGVDLNRNFAFLWNTVGTSPHPCDQIYPGSAADSEPETVALRDLLGQLFTARTGDPLTIPAADSTQGVFVDLHSYGRDILIPWGHTPTGSPNHQQYRTLVSQLAGLTGYATPHPYDYLVSGDASAWLYAKTGVASITYEIGDNFFEPFAAVDPMFAGLRQSFLYLIDIADRPYQAKKIVPFVHLLAQSRASKEGDIVRLTNTSQTEGLIVSRIAAASSASESATAYRFLPLDSSKCGNSTNLRKPFVIGPEASCEFTAVRANDVPNMVTLTIESNDRDAPPSINVKALQTYLDLPNGETCTRHVDCTSGICDRDGVCNDVPALAPAPPLPRDLSDNDAEEGGGCTVSSVKHTDGIYYLALAVFLCRRKRTSFRT